MICGSCREEKCQKDFLLRQPYCYQCIYKIKTKKIKHVVVIRKNYCRVCEKEIIFKKDAKKRQRNVFCSLECATEGHREATKNHWTRKARSVFAKRRNFKI